MPLIPLMLLTMHYTPLILLVPWQFWCHLTLRYMPLPLVSLTLLVSLALYSIRCPWYCTLSVQYRIRCPWYLLLHLRLQVAKAWGPLRPGLIIFPSTDFCYYCRKYEEHRPNPVCHTMLPGSATPVCQTMLPGSAIPVCQTMLPGSAIQRRENIIW